MNGFANTRATMTATIASTVVCACLVSAVMLGLSSCSSSAGSSQTASTSTSKAETTVEGNQTPTAASAFHATFTPSTFSKAAAITDGVSYLDMSHAAEGYFGASTTNASKMKLQVVCGDASYNYDLPGDGEPIIVPANMGNGTYKLRVMQNTSGNRYVELFAASADVALTDATLPYIRPNVYCDYSQTSACVTLANQLCANATSDSDAFDKIYDYVTKNISYDYNKADFWATATGYEPNPDETLASGKGICFDYASLTAAMLRSQGIPTKIITGYVAPDNIYHAWDMIYIDGSWSSLHISAPSGSWGRADLTFAANGASSSIGNGTSYTDRYTY